jgi:thymidylate kinase
MTCSPPPWLEPYLDQLEQRELNWTSSAKDGAARSGGGSLVVTTQRRSVDAALDALRHACCHQPTLRVVHWSQRGAGRARVVLTHVMDGRPSDHVVLVVRGAGDGSSFRDGVPGFRDKRVSSGGVNIVLYGPDGVGKSSAAAGLARALRTLGVPHGAVRTYHAFIETDRLEARSESIGTAVKARTYGWASQPTVRSLLLIGAYVKRLWLLTSRVRPWVQAGGIAIHDRYLVDVFLKSWKSQPRASTRLERVLSRTAPPDDLVFVLRAGSRVVNDRTGELSPAEVEDAYALLDRCLVALPCGHVDIDANRSPSEVIDDLVAWTLALQTDRFVER